MSFIEERLLDGLEYGFTGGPTWLTRKLSLRSGIQRRNVSRSRPIHRFRGSFDAQNDAAVQILLATFNATRGAAYGFRFTNPMDHEANGDVFYTAQGGVEEVQLQRVYSFGSESVLVPIKKPNNDVTLTADGVGIASSVDTTTGIVTFSANAGEEIAWSGTFDIPVMFENDEFAATLVDFNISSIDVQLEEDLSA